MKHNEIDKKKETSENSRQWEEMEIKKKALNVSVNIPTKDLDIRNIFRLLKEPLCLFGEDSYDRRTRLKNVLIDKYNQLLGTQKNENATEEKGKGKGKEMNKVSEADPYNKPGAEKLKTEENEKELEVFLLILKRYYIDLSNFFEVGSADHNKIKKLGVELQKRKIEEELAQKKDAEKLDTIRGKFYTESIEELHLSRLNIALHTLPRIYRYKHMIHTYQKEHTKEEYETCIQRLNDHMKTNLELHISQLGDNRPLTKGKFSPNNRCFAVSSYNTYVRLFHYQNNNYDLLTTLVGGHTDKINDICWNYPSSYSYYSTISYDQIEKEQMLLASCSSDKNLCIWKPFAQEKEGEKNINGNKENDIINVDAKRKKVNCHGDNDDDDNDNDNNDNTTYNAQLVYQLQAHEERINQIQFHPLNTYVMTCSEDETIKFFDIEKQKELFYQEGHNSNVYSIAFNPYGNLYLSGDYHGGLMFWDIRTGRNIAKEIVHTNSIMKISFNPFFPNMFCTASADNTIQIFDLRSFSKTYKILAHNKIITDAIFEPMYGRYIVSSSFDTFIKIWDTVHFYCTKVLYNNDTKVKNVDISPDGNFLASTSLDRTWKLYHNVSNLEKSFAFSHAADENGDRNGD